MAKAPKEPDPKLTDYDTTYDQLAKLPDSPFAITAAALLDKKLKLVLSTFGDKQTPVVRDLMQPERALGTYGSRTRLSYVLGIMSENEYLDLTAVGTFAISSRTVSIVLLSLSRKLRGCVENSNWVITAANLPRGLGSIRRSSFY